MRSILMSRTRPRLWPWVLLAAPALAPAGSVAQTPARIDPVVVTATRTPQPLASLLADLTVIDAAQIRASGAEALSDLLMRQPGVEVTRNGGPGATTGVFLRGTNRGQTLVLVDGMRVGSATVGAASLEAIPLAQVERIEILRGPASSLYGADAIGGVIQVFTRRATSGLAAYANAGYGTYATGSAAAGIAGALGPVQVDLNAGAQRSEGYNVRTDPAAFGYNPDRDGYRSANGSASASYAWADGQTLAARYFVSRMNNQFDGSPAFDDRTITTLQTWQVDSVNRIDAAWTSRLAVGQGSDDSVSQTAFGDFPYKTTETQFGWQNDVTLPVGLATLALERRVERIATTDAFSVSERTTNAVQAAWQGEFADQALQANLRYDRSSQYGGHTSGAVAWGWRFAPGWRVTAGAGTGFKPPSFNDLYYPGFSNPDLQPETSRNVEAGLRWQGAEGEVQLAGSAVAFYNRVSDLIVFQCDPDFNCLPANIADARLPGVTLAGTLAWRDTTAKLSVDLQSPEDAATGRLLPRRARVHGALDLAQQAGAWRFGAQVVAASRRYDDAANLRPLGGYTIVNLSAAWTLDRGVSLLLRGDNVLGRDYELAYGYSMGGAQVFAQVRWQH